MELHLEVVLLSTIKRKKPWPRFCWLGLEKESVFLLDDSRISEINMVSGRTKRKIPKLQPLLQRALTTAVSQNGMWLTGLLVSGDVFLWSKDRGCLKMIDTAPSVSQLVTAAHEGSVRLSLLVSGDGRRLLLTALTGQVFLWECSDRQDLAGTRDGAVKGRWQQILPSERTALPSPQNKEASQNSLFAQGEAVGDCCLTAFVFTVGAQLNVTFLKIQWEETVNLSPVGYSVRWVTQTYPLAQLSPPCGPVKSRGALVPAFSPDGQLLAVALNQRDPRATQVLFVSTQNFVTVSSWLGGCGSKNLSIPSKYVRSYWVACMSWAQGGLYLACVLKRGSLLLLARLGGLISLSTSGCSVELGPAHFLPLHPLVTCRLPAPVLPHDVSPTSSCASSRDVLRQRYSVTWHPRLPYLIMSDGYMASVLRVPLQRSPAALVSSLLLHCAEGLERARKALPHSQPQVRLLLESLPTLKLRAGLQELRKQEAALSTLPLFLQEETDATDTTQLYSRTQCAGEEDSDDEGSPFPGTRVGDRGRLEFASMFDTLHAHPGARLDDLYDPAETSDPEEDTQPLLVELEQAQRSLLTAWALGVSMGGVLEDRGRLLRAAVHCAVRLARLLQVTPLREPQRGEKPRTPWLSRVWPLFRNLYSLLPWDVLRGGEDSCLGVAVELTRRITQLILSPGPGSPKHGYPGLFSKTLSSALLFLRMALRSLDLAYSLPKGAPLLSSDAFSVPFLHEGDETGVSQSELLTGQRPSSRLLEMWRVLYGQTLQYQVDTVSQLGNAQCSAEQGRTASILYQIQRVLQEHGDQLGDGPTLHRVAGEEHFLSGSYAESARVWRAVLCEEKERGGALLCILETRFCLALLYGHLFQYQLRQAQGLCDRLARQLIPWSKLEEESGAEPAEDVEQVGKAWLPVDVGQEAACAVVQSFGRFMAAFFTNRPLTILPPHSVDVLPPLHLPAGPALGQRLVPLCRSTILGEVRRQQLSEVWTVDCALDLLLQGGLLPEAAWLAHSLGDWKTAASLSLAYTTYCRDQSDFSRLKWRELCLPAHLQPGSIFQNQLECLLGLEAGNVLDQSGADSKSYKHFADAVMEEGLELQVSVQEILRASVMAQVDVLSQPLHSLIEAAKDLASHLSGLVPPAVYLPAPPLYCPQPASDTQVSAGDVGVVSAGDVGVVSEGRSRQCISGVLQRALLLFRSANCSLPAAQWYITNLQQCQLLLHKKCSQSLNPFPEGLKEFVTSGAFFSSGTNGEGHMDSVTVKVIACFREVCALCWMLHVRDQLSISCRKYQSARAQVGLSQGCDSVYHTSGSDVVQRCMDTLRWACRLLPFSRFLKAEEILQDLVLSLASELPPITMVADILAQVFPEEEESVQVSLREKYSGLLQRLRHCTLPVSELGGAQPEREAMVTVLIQQQLVHRRQVLRRIAKHLAPMKRQIWERIEEDEEEDRSFDRFSPSRSTLSDCRCSPQSDDNRGATPTLSQEKPVFSSKQQNGQNWSDSRDGVRSAERGTGWSREKEAVLRQTESTTLPPVGTWEFELLDEEYPRFLVLFLSYVLERDCAEDKDCALPLLSGFSSQLRETELHSLAFDVLTSLKRRQRGQQDATGRRHGGAQPLASQAPPWLPSSDLNLPTQTEAHMRSSTACSLPTPGAGKPQGLFSLRQLHQPMRATQAEGAWTGSEASQSYTEWTPLPAPPTLDLPRPEARFQFLTRLLEWMIRWADRRVRVSHPTSRRNGAAAAEGVVMRAKASTPAVLTAMRVLECRYTAALLATEKHCPYYRVPEGEMTAGPVQPEMERTVDTVCTASSGSDSSLESLHGDISEVTELEEMEPEADVGRAIYQCSQEGAVPYDPESNPREAHGGSPDEMSAFPAEPEGESRREDTLEAACVPSCISVQIKTLPRVPKGFHDQTLTLADLDSDREETDGDVSHPTNDEVPGPDTDTGLEPNLQPRPVLGLHPGPQVQSLPSSSTPQPGRSPDALPPAAQPDPFSQVVQDQMFRLVQFQQMSFISLLQTMAASFPSLPPLNQTQIPTANLPPLNLTQWPISTANLPPLNQTQCPPPTANMSQQTGALFLEPRQQAPHQLGPQNQGPVTKPQSSAKKPDEQEYIIHSVDPSSASQCQSSMESIIEEVQEFPVHPEELRERQAERENFVLRSTCIPPVPHQGVPLLSAAAGPSQGISSVIPPAHMAAGIKLLQLPPPPHSTLPAPPVRGLVYSSSVPLVPREAFVHPYTAVCPDAPVTLREAGWQKPAQRASTVPQDRVRLDRGQLTHPHVPDSLGERRGRGVPLDLILTPRSHRPPPPHGLPLLRFHPEPRLPATVSRAPYATFARTLISVPDHPALPDHPGHPAAHPGLQLLQRDPDLPSKMQMGQAPPAPHLIPLQVLMGQAAQEHRSTAAGGALHRLLTVDTGACPAHTTLTSSKRQKRRDEREKEGENESIARLEGSSISPTEPDKVEPSGSALEEDFVITNESIRSALAGQDVVSRALSTAAELHAYASTQKRAPEVHDASTNTASAGDVQVDTAAPVCPGVLLNLQFPRETESPDRAQQDGHGTGRHFINVINLEDGELLHHLPSCQTSASLNGPTSTPPVTNLTPPDLPFAAPMTGDIMLDPQLEPYGRPSSPAALGVQADSESVQEKEPLGLMERESMSLSDPLGCGVGLRDVAEQTCSSWVGIGGAVEAFDTTMERSGKSEDEPVSVSDMADSLAQLVRVRGAYGSLLRLSDTQTDGLTRLGERKEEHLDQERQEVLSWMRRKQKLRLAEYRRQREERREREHRPFTPSTTQNPTSRDLSTNKKVKERKEKMLLLEHRTQRARDACSLITELLAPSPALSTLTKAPLSQSTSQSSRRLASRGCSKPEGRKGRRAQFHTVASPGRTAGVQSAAAFGQSQPKGRQLRRPDGALPDERLTHWGPRDMRGRRPAKGWIKGMGPSLREDRGRGEKELREEVEESDEEQMLSPWNPPLEIRRLLGLEEQSFVEEGNESADNGLWLKGLDSESFSESTGSILSKLDWTVIEKMVAGEEV
ncbi:hypothetical protein SKAU_G00283720 [Synaphobranchus kaupii]|uniref:Ciliogenesis and planar polarity effector 1 n=1 Tax=Synaphobranchus kaupii TaxID=118154 RepID=A0A9Q1EXL7_SYNKA|nr:hypothetical protein SKAU_G00283720 [Synaphobranchus kaupii]